MGLDDLKKQRKVAKKQIFEQQQTKNDRDKQYNDYIAKSSRVDLIKLQSLENFIWKSAEKFADLLGTKIEHKRPHFLWLIPLSSISIKDYDKNSRYPIIHIWFHNGPNWTNLISLEAKMGVLIFEAKYYCSGDTFAKHKNDYNLDDFNQQNAEVWIDEQFTRYYGILSICKEYS